MNTTTATASSRQIKDLSGPRGWPLLGNMFQLKASRIHQDVEQWAREFGPLFRFRVGLRNVLVVSDHELLHEKRGLSAEIAVRLAMVLRTTPETWMRMQQAVDLWEARQDAAKFEKVQPLPKALLAA